MSKISSDRLLQRGWKRVTAMGIGLLMLSGCAGGSSGENAATSSAPTSTVSSEEPTSAPSAEAAALLKDFEGKTCDGDELIMDQGNESLYCDLDANGSLIWVTAATHKILLEEAQVKAQAKAQAKAEADAKAEAQAKVEKEVAAAEKRKKEEKAAAKKKELTLTKAAPKTSAAKPSVQGFVAPKPKPKATATPKPTPRATPKPKPKSSGSAYYKNCSAVRAAGKAPIHAGEPGYSRKLDRDGDGVACE